jgi:hypothetical protein
MKGLSFSEPMVKAWMEGRKTVTRRLIKVPNIGISGLAAPEDWNRGRADMRMPTFETWGPQSGSHLFLSDTETIYALKSTYRPGETVYIKETWRAWFPTDEEGQPIDGGWHIRYKADNVEIKTDMGWDEGSQHTSPYDVGLDKEPTKWKSPRFMPEWAARSHARIVSVIPERIQEINEIDAYLEGFRDQLRGETFWPVGAQFKEIWNELHPGSWERNDWVWRIELEKV